MAGQLRHSPVLCGLARNPALPVELLEAFIAAADTELCLDLAWRDDLTAGHVMALAASGRTDTAVRLARRGLLRAEMVDGDDPQVVLALFDEVGAPAAWAYRLAASPDPKIRGA